MARGKKTEKVLTSEEKLEQALVPVEEQPYPVPENWCWTRLGNITEIVGGGTPSSSVKEYYEDGTIPWISPSDLSGYNDVYISYGAKNITKLGLEKSSARIIPANSVCLSTRAPIGYVAIAKNELCTNQGFKSFLPSPCYIPKYLFWYLKGNKKLLESYASGTTFLELSAGKVATVEFPLAPIAEQQRIAERIERLFTKLDEAKEKMQAVLDGFETRKAAILHKAFTGELTEKWREKKGIGLESWIKCKLADVLVEKPRNGYSPKPVNYKTPYKSMTLSATTSGVFKREYFKYINEIIPEDSYLWLQPGDILIQRANSLDKVGICAVYTGKQHEFIYPDLMMKLKITDTNDHAYIAYFLNSRQVRKYYMENATGTAGNMPKINQKVVLETPIVFPSKDEQSEIVRILSNVFEKEQRTKEIGDSVLEQIEIMKKSILAHAFRGELGTNNPSGESATVLLKDIL